MVLIVLDTDVIVAGLRSPTGGSAEILRKVRRNELRMAASVALFAEYEAVCTRDEHIAAAELSREDVGVFLDGLAMLVEPVPIYFTWRPQLRDPADELVLEAAVNADVDALVSFNTRHFIVASMRFGLRLATPREFLTEFL